MSINILSQQWGFHPMQEAYFNSLKEAQSSLVAARVVFSSHDQYRVLVLGEQEERQAKVRGSFYHTGQDLPAVGDWVVVDTDGNDHEFLPIENILPRTSALKRTDARFGYQVLVANVDYVCLVTSLNQDLNPRRIERGLAMIEESGATPMVLLNKQDLVSASEAAMKIQELKARFGDLLILPCSAYAGQGIAEICSFFKPGQSITFLGMSGVGKSSLINAILGQNQFDTGGIRLQDSRGRHTTTHRKVVLSKQGFWVVDSPGIREFSIYGDEESLGEVFEDISLFMQDCRFRDCSHHQEPGCRVLQALEDGELSLDRWNNYLKMKREMSFQISKADKAMQSVNKKQNAKRSVTLRKILKEKGRR